MSKCKSKKVVVFDLDETIGHFYQLSIFIKGLELYIGKKLTELQQHKLLEIYMEYFRTDIFKIFQYLKQKKSSCLKVIIYTNNMGPKSWTLMIKRFIEKQVGGPLFDRVIAGWKVNNKIQEKTRTTYQKTYQDLLRSAKLGKNSQILFFDDQNHEHMKNSHINYIQVNEYFNRIPTKILITRFLNSPLGKKLDVNNAEFKEFITMYLQANRYDMPKKHRSIAQEKRYTNKLLNEIKRFLKGKMTIKKYKKRRNSLSRKIS